MDAQPKKMGKLRASYLLAAESFEFLRKDPEIMWFPVLAGLCHLVLFGTMIAIMLAIIPFSESEAPNDFLLYGVLLVWYLGAAFVFTFFQGALATVVRKRIEGENPTFSDGMRNAQGRIGKFFIWSLIAATVGVVIQFISDKFGWMGKLFGFAGSVAWGLLTFFIVPVLALEDKSVRASLGRSGSIFQQTWGETLIMNFSLGLFFMMLYILVIVLMGVTVFFGANNVPLMIVGLTALILLMLIIAVVQSALSAIFKVVLYEYAANGKIADSFTPELIIGALTKKEAPAA